MTPNRGYQPDDTYGLKVRVRFRNGAPGKDAWPADKLRWTLLDHDYDIAAYEVVP